MGAILWSLVGVLSGAVVVVCGSLVLVVSLLCESIDEVWQDR